MGKGNNSPPEILKAIRKLSQFFAKHKIKYCLIGGLAVQVRGEPRFTRDIDVSVLTSLKSQKELITLLATEFVERFSGAQELALSNQILPLIIEGVEVDIAIGLTQFEAQMIAAASLEKLSRGLSIPVCSAEDLIVNKVIAARPKDIHDIQSIMLKNLGSVSIKYIRNLLGQFEAELDTSELLSTFEKCVEDIKKKGN